MESFRQVQVLKDRKCNMQRVYEQSERLANVFLINCSRFLVKVYCNMSSDGPWMQVADINPAKHSCPPSFRKIGSPRSLCLRTTAGCSSAYFATHGVPYSEIKGYAYAYQVSLALFGGIKQLMYFTESKLYRKIKMETVSLWNTRWIVQTQRDRTWCTSTIVADRSGGRAH